MSKTIGWTIVETVGIGIINPRALMRLGLSYEVLRIIAGKE